MNHQVRRAGGLLSFLSTDGGWIGIGDGRHGRQGVWGHRGNNWYGHSGRFRQRLRSDCPYLCCAQSRRGWGEAACCYASARRTSGEIHVLDFSCVCLIIMFLFTNHLQICLQIYLQIYLQICRYLFFYFLFLFFIIYIYPSGGYYILINYILYILRRQKLFFFTTIRSFLETLTQA